MASPVTERFRRWFEYEKDAHAKVFAALETVPVENRDTAEFRKAVTLMAHIVAARRVWLSRLGAISAQPGPLFPENADVSRVADEWRALAEQWTNYLAGIDDPDLVRELEYQSLDGNRFRSRVEDILAQTFGHSWYHRGQIAMLIRAAGGQPAITDLIFWSREPLDRKDG